MYIIGIRLSDVGIYHAKQRVAKNFTSGISDKAMHWLNNAQVYMYMYMNMHMYMRMSMHMYVLHVNENQ